MLNCELFPVENNLKFIKKYISIHTINTYIYIYIHTYIYIYVYIYIYYIYIYILYILYTYIIYCILYKNNYNSGYNSLFFKKDSVINLGKTHLYVFLSNLPSTFGNLSYVLSKEKFF